MADSKVLYTPGKGLRHLERGLWAALGLLGHRPRTWRDVWHCLAPRGPRPRCSRSPGMPTTTCRRPWIATPRRSSRWSSLAGRAGRGRRAAAGRAEPGDLRGGVQRTGRAARLEGDRPVAPDARPGRPNDRAAAARADLVDLRQARRAESLWAAAGRTFSRVADRDPRRRARSEASIASARPSGASRSAFARRPSRACRPRWPRWPRSISASWPCGP